jgi:hypothetical protein
VGEEGAIMTRYVRSVRSVRSLPTTPDGRPSVRSVRRLRGVWGGARTTPWGCLPRTTEQHIPESERRSGARMTRQVNATWPGDGAGLAISRFGATSPRRCRGVPLLSPSRRHGESMTPGCPSSVLRSWNQHDSRAERAAHAGVSAPTFQHGDSARAIPRGCP